MCLKVWAAVSPWWHLHGYRLFGGEGVKGLVVILEELADLGYFVEPLHGPVGDH